MWHCLKISKHLWRCCSNNVTNWNCDRCTIMTATTPPPPVIWFIWFDFFCFLQKSDKHWWQDIVIYFNISVFFFPLQPHEPKKVSNLGWCVSDGRRESQITGGAGEINNPRGAYEHILSQSEPNWGDKNNPELDDRTWVTTRGDREQTATVTRRLNEDRNIWSENSTASPYLSSPTLSPALQPNNLLEKITKKKNITQPHGKTHISNQTPETLAPPWK